MDKKIILDVFNKYENEITGDDFNNILIELFKNQIDDSVSGEYFSKRPYGFIKRFKDIDNKCYQIEIKALYPNILIEYNLPLNVPNFAIFTKELLEFYNETQQVNIKRFINMIFGKVNTPNSPLKASYNYQYLVSSLGKYKMYNLINKFHCDNVLGWDTDTVYIKEYNDELKDVDNINIIFDELSEHRKQKLIIREGAVYET